MYEQFPGLDRRPFAPTPDADCLVETATARKAIDALRRAVLDGGAIAVLTAPAGLGKTLVCRRLLAELPENFDAAFVPSTNFDERRTLLLSLLFELGAPYTSAPEDELRLRLDAHLRERAAAGRRIAVVLDEAHLLDARLLDEVRTLVDASPDGRPLVSVVLSGQLALEEVLAEPGHEAVNQRIQCHVLLESLTRDQSREYVAGRIGWAGGHVDDCFDEEALGLIARIADGSPRGLNLLCDQTLMLAQLDERRPADAECVLAAYEALRHLPQQWNAPPSEFETDELPETSWSEDADEASDALAEETTPPFEIDFHVHCDEDETQPTPTDVMEEREMFHESRETSAKPAPSVFEVGGDAPSSVDSASRDGVLEIGWGTEPSMQEGAENEATSAPATSEVDDAHPAPVTECVEVGRSASTLLGKFDEPVQWTEEVRVERRIVLRGIALDPSACESLPNDAPVADPQSAETIEEPRVLADPTTVVPEIASEPRLEEPAEAAEIDGVAAACTDACEEDSAAVFETDIETETEPAESTSVSTSDMSSVDPTPMLESALGFVISSGDPNEFDPVADPIDEFAVPDPPVVSEHVLFGEEDSVFVDRTEFDLDPIVAEARYEQDSFLSEPSETTEVETIDGVPEPVDDPAADESAAVVRAESKRIDEVVEPEPESPVTSNVEAEPEFEEFGLERQIESNLREIARETAKALASSQAALHRNAEIAEYDVVEPEATEPAPVEQESWLEADADEDAAPVAAERPAEPVATPPAPEPVAVERSGRREVHTEDRPYARLFSELKQRHQESRDHEPRIRR